MNPFRDGSTFDIFRNHIDKVTLEINNLDNEYVMKASPTELEQYYVNKVIIEPLILHSNDRYIKNQSSTKIDVSRDYAGDFFPTEHATIKGTQIEIAIPFEGDPILWRIRASTFSVGGYPDIQILGNEIVFCISFSDDSADPNMLRSQIDRSIESLDNAVEYLKHDVDRHNNSAPNTIRNVLEHKRKLSQSAIGAVAALGMPIKKTGKEPTFTIPTKRRESPVKRPSVETGKYEPEPALDEKEYKHILDILRSMSLVIERSPSSFASLDEETIRDHFLLQLNGHYEGNASGETFNASGKTDILIRIENKNVFIAECKFWRGQKSFDEAINQLLGYLTWRDSKCALLVFNRTRDSSAVRQKMHEVMEARSEHRKTLVHGLEGDSKYVLVKELEPGREIIVTTQLYDVPSKE